MLFTKYYNDYFEFAKVHVQNSVGVFFPMQVYQLKLIFRK